MDWYDNGGGMMNGSGYAIFGMILMLILFAVLIWVIFRVVDHGSHVERHHGLADTSKSSTLALEHLNMRLAKGEVSVDEYAILKEHLTK